MGLYQLVVIISKAMECSHPLLYKVIKEEVSISTSGGPKHSPLAWPIPLLSGSSYDSSKEFWVSAGCYKNERPNDQMPSPDVHDPREAASHQGEEYEF
jgi:hypothetical protein